MRVVFFVLAFLFTTSAFAQVQTTLEYRYFFNSDVDFTDHQIYNPARPYAPLSKTTVASNTHNSLIGVSFYIPFNVFDEISLLYSNCFSFEMDAYYQFDHNIGSKPIQQYYRFALNFQFVDDVPLYLYTTLNTASTFKYAESPVIDGYEYKVGVNFNITDQDDSDLINFFAGVNYLVYHEFNTLKPYGNVFNATGDFETHIGLIINIKNFFYLEQGIRTLTDFNYPEESFTFSPYYSDYKTTASIKIKKFTLNYTHVCFHPIESDDPNPKVGGQLNSFGMLFDF